MDTRNKAEESVFSPSAVHVPRDEKVMIEKRPEIDKNILDRQRGVNKFGNLFPLHFCDSFSYGKSSLWAGSPAFGGITHKKHRPRYFGFRIADSWLLVAGFSLLVPSLPILYSFNQQQGTSNKELIFQSAFRNLQSAIWRRGKGSARVLQISWKTNRIEPYPLLRAKENNIHRPRINLLIREASRDGELKS